MAFASTMMGMGNGYGCDCPSQPPPQRCSKPRGGRAFVFLEMYAGGGDPGLEEMREEFLPRLKDRLEAWVILVGGGLMMVHCREPAARHVPEEHPVVPRHVLPV